MLRDGIPTWQVSRLIGSEKCILVLVASVTCWAYTLDLEPFGDLKNLLFVSCSARRGLG